MSTFVLLHGAWHGGWCWRRVADILRARGHYVTTPTLTGLGERSHLMSENIALQTFGDDLVQHLHYEGLTDVVLVGHSFGGSPISYAAEQERDRIARLVYLDAQIIEGGMTPLSNHTPEMQALRRQIAEDTSGGLSLPPPPAEAMGVTDPDDAAWLERLMTPHPFRTWETPLNIDGQIGAGLPASYIVCTQPLYAPLEAARQRARGLGWSMPEIAAGHDAMVTAPLALADMLEAG